MAGEGRNLSIRVVTPEGALFKGEATFVAAPAVDGEVGILPRHTPLIARLGIGPLRVEKTADSGGETLRFAVRGGFLQVVNDEVTLLVTQAATLEQTVPGELRAEREILLARLRKPESDEQFAELLADRTWLETREGLAG